MELLTFWSFPHSWHISGFVTRATWRVTLVEQELLIPRFTRVLFPNKYMNGILPGYLPNTVTLHVLKHITIIQNGVFRETQTSHPSPAPVFTSIFGFPCNVFCFVCVRFCLVHKVVCVYRLSLRDYLALIWLKVLCHLCLYRKRQNYAI
jgi:hypothetical protein